MTVIFRDRKYQRGTIFIIISAVVNQCSGINAINVYSNEILLKIPGVPVNVGVYMLYAGQVVGALTGPII